MSATQKLLRFGVYELNLATEELRKNGIPLKLPPQPFRILALLASRAGQLVTREEIEKQIWGDGTYVDFEHGLNQCIKQIRTALNDNSDAPLYIETLPRRGYRFVAPVVSKTIPAPGLVTESRSGIQSALPVTAIAEASALAPAPAPVASLNANLSAGIPSLASSTSATSVAGAALAPAREQSSIREPSVRSRRVTILVSLAVLCTVVIVIWLWRARTNSVLAANDSIVLADFANSTSDPVFDDAMNRALQVALRQTPFLNLLATDKIGGTLKLLKHSPGDKLTPELALEVCSRTNSRAVVAGRVSDEGNGFRIGLTATNCKTGKVIAVSELDTASREQVVKTLGIATANLRRKLGEPEFSLREFDKPLDEATSPSLEALQEVTLASNIKRQHGDAAAAVAHLKRAVELDPNYAQAYVALGIGYLNAHDAKLSAEYLGKAYELRDPVTQRDRFQIEAFYYIGITHQQDKAAETLTDAVRTYPNDPIAHMNLSANLMEVGQYEKAVAEAQESIRLTPSGAAYVNLMTSYLALERLDAAKATFDEAQANKVDDIGLYVQRYLLGFQQGDEAAMQEQLNHAQGKPKLQATLLCAESSTQAFHGRVRKSGELLQQATGHGADPQVAAECKALHAVLQAEIGNLELSRREAAEAQTLNPSANVRTSSALSLARSGNLAEAEKLADELSQENPQATIMQDYSLPTIRAAIELQKNNPAQAIEILKVATPYELGFGPFSSLYPAYIRGEAYLKLGQGQLAAAEFQKLIDHPGIVSNFVTGALAHLQLARAQAMAGDSTAARKSYDQFFALWKDADPDVPIYKQAKAEYARLP